MSLTWTPTRMVDTVRRIIGDPKYEYIQENMEDVGMSTGTSGETYYALNVPVQSGCTVRVRGFNTATGRHYYYRRIWSLDDKTEDERQFFFNYNEGSAFIPSGCTEIASGDRVKMTYTWESEIDTLYSDDNLWLYLTDAIVALRQKKNHSYDLEGVTVSGGSISPDDISEELGWLIVLQGSLMVLQGDQRQYIRSAIVIREADITFDNTRATSVRKTTVDQLAKDLEEAINKSLMLGHISVASKIDVYSTKDWGYSGIGEWHDEGGY